MTLNSPFQISSRLLPAVQIEDTYISLEHNKISSDNRNVWTYYIDNPAWEYTASDLRSGCGGETLQKAMENLLGFLAAAGESYRTMEWTEKTPIFFPEHVTAWAYQHSEELTMLRLELEENQDLIED